MLPLGTAWAVARFSRIFGGFLRFLTRYGKEPRRLSRPTRPGQLPVITASRSAGDGQRLAGWYVWGMGRGAGRGWFNSFKPATSAS